jgi:hypothetical protein
MKRPAVMRAFFIDSFIIFCGNANKLDCGLTKTIYIFLLTPSNLEHSVRFSARQYWRRPSCLEEQSVTLHEQLPQRHTLPDTLP